jgi:hypothetical protein
VCPWEILTVTGISCVAFALYSLSRGQDLNWDQLNYHFYSGWALHSRMRVDLFAAGFQTYYNHLFYLPFYLLVKTFQPRTAAMLLAGLHALNVPALYVLSRMLIKVEPRRLQIFLAALATIAGVFSPMFLSEVGTSFVDVFSGVVVLVALVMAFQGVREGVQTPRQMLLLGVSGFALGALGGIKLVNLPFAIGLGLGLLCIQARLGEKLRWLGAVGAGALVGFLSTGAHLAWVLWSEYHNPLFPHYNSWFKSPFFTPDDIRDVRSVPKSVLDGMGYALQWATGAAPNNELPFRDVRFAIIIALFALSALIFSVVYFGREYVQRSAWDKGRADRVMSVGHSRVLLVFFGTGYLTWLFMFGIQRYLVPLELLAGLVLLCLLDLLIYNRSAKLLAAIVTVVFSVVMVKVPDWGHVPWGTSWYGVKLNPQLTRENTLYLALSEPIGYVFPFLPWSSRLIAIRAPESLDGIVALRDRIAALVETHRGPVRILAHQRIYATDHLAISHWLAPYKRKLGAGECTTIPTRAGELVSCPVERFELPAGRDEVLHVGFNRDMAPSGYVFSTVRLGKTFTIEAVVRTSASQVAYSTITSNHPGSHNFQGVSIEQMGPLANRYAVGLGSGTQWMSAGQFQLSPGKRSYIALVVADGQARLYLNGELASMNKLAGPVAESDYPLSIGNWINKDRMFTGIVEEYRLSRYAVGSQTILRSAELTGTIGARPKPRHR